MPESMETAHKIRDTSVKRIPGKMRMTLLCYYLEPWRPELAPTVKNWCGVRQSSGTQEAVHEEVILAPVWPVPYGPGRILPQPHQYLCIRQLRELERLSSEMEALGNTVQKHRSLSRFSCS